MSSDGFQIANGRSTGREGTEVSWCGGDWMALAEKTEQLSLLMKGCSPGAKRKVRSRRCEVRMTLASLLIILASLWLLPGAGVASLQGATVGLLQEGQASESGVVNFSEVAAQEAGAKGHSRIRPHRIKRKPQTRTFDAASTPASDVAPADPDVWFTAASAPPSPPASASFLALLDNAVAFNPDTAGAVGPNHLLVVLESEMRVQNRSGGVISTVSIDAFWGSLGNSNVFDTRVIYDNARQRWITTAIGNPAMSGSSLLIAVSQTSDPTGNWNRHRIQTDLVNGTYPDSPNIGLARDWVVVTANMMNQTGLFFENVGIFAFNRTNLYAGGERLWQYTYAPSDATLSEVNVLVPAVSYDENATTNFMVANWDGSFAGGAGRLRLFSVSGPVDAPVFNDYTDAPAGGLFAMAGPGFGSPSWVSEVPTTINFAPQLGTTNKIFIGDARIQNVVYRDGALWCAQHVFLPTNLVTRCAVQWWCVTPGGTVLQHGRMDDPSGAKFYAYPSIAVNRYEDVLIGYSRFAANQYPSANYAFHGYQAGPGQLLADTVLKSGEGKFTVADDGLILWGDWSATMVDPVNDTDMWTIQEYASAPVGGVDRWGTWWGRVSPPASLSLSVTDSPDPVVATSNVTYTIQVTNNTTHVATGVRVTNTLPVGAVYVSAQSSQGGCLYTTNGVVTCDFGDVAGDLNSNVVVTATVVARLNQSGTATNSVTVSAFGPDDFPADNTIKVLTTVTTAADLALTVSAAPSPVVLSNNITYSLTVTNRGPSAATAVSLTNTLPAGVAYVSATPSQGTCSQVGSNVTCSFGTLALNAGVSVTIVGRANVSGFQTNRAVVGSTALDVNPANSSASVVVKASAAPVLQTILPRTINEDTVLGPVSFTVSDLETPAGALTLTAASSNPSVVPTTNIAFGGAGTDRNITVTPAPNANGTVNIWRILTDSDGIATSNFFSLTITADNDPPTISDITNQVANEDTVIGPINFTVGDVESGGAALNVTGASSNPTLIPNANLVFGGAGSNRTLTIRPATNQFGAATITVTVSDGIATTNDTFLVTINSVNDLPTITDITNRVVAEDTAITAGFIIGDVETSVAALTLTGSSSNQALVPNSNISFTGTGSSRTVTVMPATNQFGNTTITISVIDGDNGTNSDTFVLTVSPVNDPPTLNSINPITINEDSGPTNIVLTGISSGATNEFQNLTITAKSDKPSILPNPTVVSNSPTTAILTMTPVANSNGIVTVTVSVDDGGLSNNIISRQFTVTIREVNDPPVISPIADQTINEDATTGLIPFTIGDVETPAAALSVFTRSSDTTLIPDANVVLGGTLSNRNVTVSPAANQFGRATVTVFVSDGAATNSRSFVVTVLQVNDAPTISAVTNRTILEDTMVIIDFTIGDLETPLANLALTASSSNALLTPNISFGGSGSNRTVTIVPGTNLSGSANITLAVIDTDGASNTTSFVLTVLPVDDPPTLDSINNLTIPEDSPLQTVLLTGISSGATNELQTLRVSAVSDNQALIRDPTVIYTSANATGRLEFAPSPDANGIARISVSVSDGVSTNSRSFNVTVTPVNDPPVISSITNREIAEDTTASIPFYVNDLETPPDQLILQVSSSNLELVDETGLSITGTGTNRTLRVTPLPDQSGGFSTITITVTDGSNAMAIASFDLTVRPVNDPPVISGLVDLMIARDSGPVQVNFTVSDPESLPSSLAVTAVSSNQALVPDANISLTGNGADRTLTFTPASHATGTVVITVRVMDDGSGGGSTNQANGAFTVQVFDASMALRIEHIGTNAVLSWTTNNPMSWLLQSTTNVASAGAWNNAGPTPVVTGDRYVVTNAVSGPGRFYRLKKQ